MNVVTAGLRSGDLVITLKCHLTTDELEHVIQGLKYAPEKYKASIPSGFEDTLAFIDRVRVELKVAKQRIG